MRVLLALLIMLTGAAPASAAFLDCKGAAMLAILKPHLPKFKCVEIQSGKANGIPVRYLWNATDKTFGATIPPAFQVIAIANDTIAKAEKMWSPLAALQTHEVSFVIGSAVKPMESTKGLFKALTISPRSNTGEQDCIVLLDLNQIWKKKGAVVESPELEYIIAHEFAHCIQRWNYPLGWLTQGMDWWLEGIATTLGQVVAPEAKEPRSKEADFLAKIGQTPFTKLSYENGLLFQWLWNVKPAALFQFMFAVNAMDGVTLDDEVEQLLGVAKGAQGMDDFVRKLVDNGIASPTGWRPGALKPGAQIVVSASGTVPVPGEPYTVQYRPVLFKSGRYAATLSANGTPLARGVRPDGTRAWSADFPLWMGSGDCATDAGGQIVVMKAAKAATAQIDSDLKSKCQKTALSSGTSQSSCPAGSWEIDNAARAALLSTWIGRTGEVTATSGTMRFGFAPDGTATVTGKDFAADITGPTTTGMPPFNVHVAMNGTDTGTWSASAGLLTYKNGGGTLKLDIAVKVAGMSFPAPSVEPFNDGQWKYDCSGDTLHLTYVGPQKVSPGHVPAFTLHQVTHW